MLKNKTLFYSTLFSLFYSCADKNVGMSGDHATAKKEEPAPEGDSPATKDAAAAKLEHKEATDESDNIDIKSEHISDAAEEKAKNIGGECIAKIEDLNGKRPLLELYQTIYTSEKIKQVTWQMFNDYKIDALSSIELVQAAKFADEFIDPKVGGVTNDNLAKAMEFILGQAKAFLPPADAKVAIAIADKLEIIAQAGQTAKGTGWGWNSILYEHDKKVFEIIYFYMGMEVATANGHFDSEHRYIGKPFKVKDICDK